MKKRAKKVTLVAASIFILFVALAPAVLYLTVKSGRLREYVQGRAERATGLEVRMGSLQPKWLGAEAKNISVALPGQGDRPLLVADRIELKSSLSALLRGELVLVELVSPRISVSEAELKTIDELLSSRAGEDDEYSLGLIRVSQGDVSLFFPPAQVHLEKVNATFGASVFAKEKNALRLNFRRGRFSFEREKQNPYEFLLTDFRSKVSFGSRTGSLEIEGDADALVTADVPAFAFPPEVPVGLSLAADYLPQQKSLQNALLELDIPLLENARAYGSVSRLDANPSADVRFEAQLPQVGRLVEYIGALKRLEYEHVNVEGSVRIEGAVKGTLGEPRVSLTADAELGNAQWDGLSMTGFTAHIPALFEAGAYAAGPAIIGADSVSLPLGGQIISASKIAALLSADPENIRADDVRASVEKLGAVSGQASYQPASGDFTASASMKNVPSREAVNLLFSALGKPSNKIALSGLSSIDLQAEGTYTQQLDTVNAHFLYSLTDGEFSASDSLTLSGLNANLEGALSSEDAGQSWNFETDGGLGKFTFRGQSFEKAFSEESYPVSFSGIYGWQTNILREASAALDFGPSGKITASGDIGFASGEVDLSMQADDLNIQEVSQFVSAAFFKIPDDLSLAGIADMEGRLTGNFQPSPRNLDGSFEVKIRDGEFASGELIMAAGVGAEARGSFASDTPGESWTFDVRGKAGGFELLVQTYYNSFQDDNFPFSFSGAYIVDERTIRDLAATLGLTSIGTLSANGDVKLAPDSLVDLRVQSESLDLSRLYEEIGKQALSVVSPVFEEARVEGRAAGEVALRMSDASWEAQGRLKVDDGGFALGDDSFSVNSAQVDLPFAFYSPEKEEGEKEPFKEEHFGTIRLGGLALGPASVPAIDFEVALRENALYMKQPPPIELLGGTLNLGELRAKNLLDSSAEMKTFFSAEGINLEPLWPALGLPKIPATMNALFPTVLLSRERISASGTAKIYTFDGTVTIDSVEIEQPLSPVRTFRADLDFDNIRLLEFTEAMNFGTITGVMEGTVEGLEFSQGQPAAFVAEFETVDKPRVRQLINFDAVENISILGTGRGFQASIGRGLFSFVDEFRYDKIGFQTTLKNDNFRLRGKVVRNDIEYFVKGVRFGPSINVINRNPGQTVSFKSMLERLSRVGRTETDESR